MILSKPFKTFVLDTNVLIHDPEALSVFGHNKISIPLIVIEELDRFKTFHDERGRNSRIISRYLDKLRKKGKLNEGIELDNGGILKIELDAKVEMPFEFRNHNDDNQILMTALALQTKGEDVYFISKDINLRIKAEAIGLKVQDYERSKVKIDELYTGCKEITITSEQIDSFYKDKKLKLTEDDLFANQFTILKSSDEKSQSALGKYVKSTKEIVPLRKDTRIWDLKPLNTEQRFAIDLLMDDNIKLVTLVGVAGTGKTLLALAAALQKTVEEKLYRRFFVLRPIMPMGRDIGFLPGTKEEKLTQWMGAIYDNLEFLMEKGTDKVGEEDTESKIQYLTETGKMEIEALTYIRGRSLPNQFIIIDDSQNLTPSEVKTIISRAGQGTKLVFTGDPYQIDNPYLDASSNGLTYVVEKLKGQDIYGHINFTKTERSPLAALAAQLL
ncbi:MAG: PhoH family protein [bacterium]|nr:PhoH family protein [bacterium]